MTEQELQEKNYQKAKALAAAKANGHDSVAETQEQTIARLTAALAEAKAAAKLPKDFMEVSEKTGTIVVRVGGSRYPMQGNVTQWKGTLENAEAIRVFIGQNWDKVVKFTDGNRQKYLTSDLKTFFTTSK